MRLALLALAVAYSGYSTLPANRLLGQEPAAAEPSPSTKILDRASYVGLADNRDPWIVPEPVELLGEIKQFDGERLALQQSDGSARTVPSPQIVSLTPHWRTAAAAQAHQLFVERRYADVVTAVPLALKSNLVQWQQRLLIAELVQAVEALGNTRAAGLYFLSLHKSNAPPMLYAAMPLCWTVREADEALLEQAQQWLSDESEAAQLMGASWLLLSDQGSAAKQALAKLLTSQNSAIAQLSRAQGWRLIAPPQTMSELNGWLASRDRLIAPLQLGPTEFIADRLMRIGRHDLAMGQWIRIAHEHADHPHRVLQALQSAHTQLSRMQRPDEAQRLEVWIKTLAPPQ